MYNLLISAGTAIIVFILLKFAFHLLVGFYPYRIAFFSRLVPAYLPHCYQKIGSHHVRCNEGHSGTTF